MALDAMESSGKMNLSQRGVHARIKGGNSLIEVNNDYIISIQPRLTQD